MCKLVPHCVGMTLLELHLRLALQTQAPLHFSLVSPPLRSPRLPRTTAPDGRVPWRWSCGNRPSQSRSSLPDVVSIVSAIRVTLLHFALVPPPLRSPRLPCTTPQRRQSRGSRPSWSRSCPRCRPRKGVHADLQGPHRRAHRRLRAAPAPPVLPQLPRHHPRQPIGSSLGLLFCGKD